ncbi:hypothetical protein Ancab_011462 [Ancistrocladus abbreviatus]
MFNASFMENLPKTREGGGYTCRSSAKELKKREEHGVINAKTIPKTRTYAEVVAISVNNGVEKDWGRPLQRSKARTLRLQGKRLVVYRESTPITGVLNHSCNKVSSMAVTDNGGNARLVVQEADMVVDEGVGLKSISQSNSNLEKRSETPTSFGRENYECHQGALGTNTTCGFINEQVARHDGLSLGHDSPNSMPNQKGVSSKELRENHVCLGFTAFEEGSNG